MVSVQPCCGLGQCLGYSLPTVHSVSISTNAAPSRRPIQFHRWPAVVPARSTWSKISWSCSAATASTDRRHLVDPGVQRVGEQPHLLGEDRAVEGEEFVCGDADLVDRCAEAHVVERDRGAVVDRPVGPLLQGQLVDGAAHPAQRQRQRPGQVAGVQPAAVHADPARVAGGQQPVAIGGGQAVGMEQERRRDDVLAARQDGAHLVEVGEPRRVHHAVGIDGQDAVDVGGCGDPDRVAADQHACVDTVLVVGIHSDTGQFESGPGIEDRCEHLPADGAGTPLDDAQCHLDVPSAQAPTLNLAAADSGMGSYLAKERVKDPAPCDSARRSIA